jgi:hypothetical protein
VTLQETNRDVTEKLYTTKQMGDACEMLVAAELTLAGVPALKVPDLWSHYDVIAQPIDRGPQRISVKSRTFARSGSFVGYSNSDEFDWLAIVILPSEGGETRRIFIVPREIADKRSYVAEPRDGRGFFVHKLVKLPPSTTVGAPVPAGGWGLADYEDNFRLSPTSLK